MGARLSVVQGAQGSGDHSPRLSISKLAKYLGKDRRTVSARLEAAGVEPAGREGGYPVYSLADAAPAIVGPDWQGGSATGRRQVDPETLAPAERIEWYKAEKARREYEVEEGKLIPATEVADTLAGVFKNVVQTLDTLPDVLDRDCGVGPVAVERSQEVLDQVREELYQRLTKRGDGDGGGKG